MAVIKEELILYDKFTKTFTSYIRQTDEAASATKAAQQATKDFSQSAETASRSAGGLGSSLKSLAAGYLSLRGLASVLNLSDTFASTTARLDMMNDGLQTTAELNNQIYESAMRTGSSYQETANLVAQLGNLAGEAFSSSGEIVEFAEQLNKQIVLSGASSQAASAAIYQLTQGLSSGALRGEELNSVLEQTPMIGKTIADYLGVSVGEMRELASEGKLTADVVKTALLSSAQETNAAFEKMPMTWGRLWNSAKTAALQAFQPVLEAVGEMAGFVSENVDIIIPAFLGLAAAVGVYTAAQWAATGAAKAFIKTLTGNPFLLLIAVAIGLVIAKIAEWVRAVGGIKAAWLTMVDKVLYFWDLLKIGVATGADYMVTRWENMALKFLESSVNLQNWMGDMKVKVLEILQDMVNGAIGIINDFIGMLNKIPGVAIDPVEELTFATTKSLENEAAKQQRNAALETARQTVENNQEQRQRQLDYMWAMREGEHSARMAEIEAARMAGSAGDSASYAGASPDYTSQLTSIETAIGDVNKSVDMGAEDLRSMVDVAERQYVNRINLTAQSPVINVNGQNTGSTAADRQNLGRVIRDILREETASGSTRQTYQPA